MALPHGPGVIEVATNLVAYDWRLAASTSSNGQQHQALFGATANGSSSSSDASASATSVQQVNEYNAQVACTPNGQHSSSVFDLTGAGPAEVAAAIAQEAQKRGLQAPGPGYITNKTPSELIAIAAEKLQHS
jgi:hypothetical protein